MKKLNWEDDGYYATETRDLSNIRRVLIVTMLLNFVATGVKLAAGIATGALSILADSLDSLFDGLSNVVGLAGLYAAAKPPDAEHPYGHRKFETIAALSIAFLLFLSCYQLLVTAWERLGGPFKPEVNVWTAGAMLVSMVVQAATSWYELRAGRRLKSEILVADALHTRASILVSGSVLAGLVFVRLGFPQADPILAAFVAVVIAKIGIDILRETLPVLVDRAALDPNDIAEVVGSVKGVESFHRVRSRGPRAAQPSTCTCGCPRIRPSVKRMRSPARCAAGCWTWTASATSPSTWRSSTTPWMGRWICLQPSNNWRMKWA